MTGQYSHSTDVLGRIVEVVSGVILDQFVDDQIAKPLGLSDTGFYVPSEKLGRIAETQVDSTTGKRWPTFDVTKRPNLMSGGAGMVSTASDYVRFSNRPFGVKHFQTIRRCSVDVAHRLALLFGIGTEALPSWDTRTRWSNL